MHRNKFGRTSFIIVGLIIFLQLFMIVPGASALSQSTESQSVPAGLTAEEWGQIRGLIDTYQQTYLKASPTDAEDCFGYSVAISGDTLVVGAHNEDSDGSGSDDNSAAEAGAVYVFVRDGFNWTQQAYLKAGNAEANDLFGYSVAISGDTLVVGAAYEDSDGSAPEDNSASYSGAAYVFVRSGTTWTQQDYLKASNVERREFFGYSVAISGDTVVVGAYGEDSNGSGPEDNSESCSGAAYVFVRSGTTWTQEDYLKASNAEQDDTFGVSVAISGDTVVVGALGEGSDGSSQVDNSESGSGAAYVFVNDGEDWAQQDYLKAFNAGESDFFGVSVAISGDTIVVGAAQEGSDGSGPDNDDAPQSGAAYVFVRSGTTWNQQDYLKAANPELEDYFGASVAVSGDMVVVGAYRDDNVAEDAGSAYVFVRSGTAWSQQAYLKADNADEEDLYGCAVAVSGDTIVLGAPYESSDGSGPENNDASNSGAVYMFYRMNQYLPLLRR